MHVLLLHGLPADSHDWDGVAARLREAGLEPLAPDRPGWGDAAGPPRSIEGNVEAALAILDAAGAGTAVVVGDSWGSLPALALAAREPARVRALGLIAPMGPGSLNVLDHVLAAPLVGPALARLELAAAGFAQSLPPLRRAIARRLAIGERPLGARGLRWLLGRTRSFVVDEREVVARLDDISAAASAVSAPALVMVGENDGMTGVAPARRLAERLPNARFVVVPDAGHLLPLAHPDLVAGELIELARRARA